MLTSQLAFAGFWEGRGGDLMLFEDWAGVRNRNFELGRANATFVLRGSPIVSFMLLIEDLKKIFSNIYKFWFMDIGYKFYIFAYDLGGTNHYI